MPLSRISGQITEPVSLPSGTDIGNVSALEISNLDGILSPIQNQFNGFQSQFDSKINTISIIQQSSSYTPTLLDRDRMIEMSSTLALNFNIPADSTVNYPVGTQIHILQTNTGQVTIAGIGGVSVNGSPGLRIRAQWCLATVIKRAPNLWVAVGDLVA